MPDVRIRVETGQATAGDGREIQETAGKGKADAKTVALSLLGHQAINTTKQILNYSISNIGNFTGNTVMQENVQAITGIMGDIASIGMATASGGWVGFAIATVGIATKYTLEAVSTQIQQRKDNNQSRFILDRSGNSTMNGSRTGD